VISRFSLPTRNTVLFLAALMAHTLFGQSPFPNLKPLEGRYEYFNGVSITFAQSPRDGVLYAILDETLYPLKFIAADIFNDRQGSRLIFQRGDAGQVSGYRLEEKHATNSFRRLSDATFPASMWFARRTTGNAPYQFHYSPPPDLADGLPVGSLAAARLDPSLIKELIEQVATEKYKNIHSILVIKSGKLVLEEYFYQYDRDTLHQLRSATKSFVSALVGIVIDQKLIHGKDEKALQFFPEYDLQNPSTDKNAITIEHLLSNQSGLACDDTAQSSPGNEIKMGLAPDWVHFILNLPVTTPPGSVGRYCSGGIIVLGRIVEKASHKALSDFAAENLFGPLGITNYQWRFKPDQSSAEDFCQLHLRPRDMAKFGLLYLNQGRWNGRQVISSDWVAASLAKHSVVNGIDYGYLWWRQWLNVNGQRIDGIAAKGNGGQRIYLWPTLDMVVVITGGNYNERSPSDELQIKYLLPAALQSTNAK
jgi:CubicO group peptidase (beta-lactamase class C family)